MKHKPLVQRQAIWQMSKEKTAEAEKICTLYVEIFQIMAKERQADYSYKIGSREPRLNPRTLTSQLCDLGYQIS